MERAGIVLCGGRSRRMGRPKALLPWFGRRMVDHVVDRLVPCVDEVVVVTSAELARSLLEPSMHGSTRKASTNEAASGSGDRAAKPIVRHVVDAEPERGPLAALRDGLAAIRADLAFVTTTDAPFLTAAHVEVLLRAAAARGGEDAARAIVPRAGGFLQVLSAVYPREAGREAASLLAAGVTSPAALASRIGASILDVAAPDALAPWTGFNTPAEYRALALRVDPAASACVAWRIEGDEAGGEEAAAATIREVPIGALGEILHAAAPRPGDVEAARAEGRLRVVLAEGELARDFDDALPIGPGERVVVHERRRGAERARAGSR